MLKYQKKLKIVLFKFFYTVKATRNIIPANSINGQVLFFIFQRQYRLKPVLPTHQGARGSA
jgi:hypothetical protein